MSRIVSYIRLDSSKGPENLINMDDLRVLSTKKLIRNWEERFDKNAWYEYRDFLSSVANKYSAFPRVTDWKRTNAEWIAPVDDDDWHLDAAVLAIDMAGDTFDCVNWRILIYDLTETCGVINDDVNYIRGPNTCGYAIRRSFLETLTEEQQFLILNDHFNAHRYTHFSGRKYLTTQYCGGVHIITPASITSALRNKGNLSFSTIDNYKSLLPQAVVGVDEIILRTIELVSK